MSFVGTVDSLSIALRVFRSLGVEDQIREVRILVDHRDVKRQGDQNDAAIMLNSRLISRLHMMQSLSGLRHVTRGSDWPPVRFGTGHWHADEVRIRVWCRGKAASTESAVPCHKSGG
jgi:hypothetical protein